ncbi:MAG: class I SAM-dependent methyltransferase [Sphingomonas sp.]|nr:class I SAM-dependent methyltransferase [Sphingomonas sp.]
MSKDAWNIFWRHGLGDGACLPGAVDANTRLQQYWTTFAGNFEAPSHVVDLACGGGIVARRLAESNDQISVTGVDYADVPATDQDRVELKSGVDMAKMPFDDASFDGAVSQFGVEYGDAGKVGNELARVLRPGAPFAFIIHHGESAVVANNAARAKVLDAVTADNVREVYVAGDRQALAKAMFDIRLHADRKDVVDEIARGLGQSMINATGDRAEAWTEFERLANGERAILGALHKAAVDKPEAWLDQLGTAFEAEGISVFRDSRDAPIAWSIFGRRA